MNILNIKLTQSQQLLVNAVLSMLASALVAAAQATYQYITQSGTINIVQVLSIFAGVLWATFSTALAVYVPAHAQQELQDLRDFKSQITTQPAQQPGPLVVIHAQSVTPNLATTTTLPTASYTPAVSQDAQSVPAAPAQVQQIPFPVQLAQTQSSDILGNIPNPILTQGLPLNGVTGQYAIYGAPAQQ